jgi:phosphatidate cytidylyltransferase
VRCRGGCGGLFRGCAPSQILVPLVSSIHKQRCRPESALAASGPMHVQPARDSGGHRAGKTWGRTPLTAISPKKTVEGALGGLGASIACAAALQAVTTWPLTLPGAVGLGVVVFIASILGDLIESVMKRDAGIKDSGTLIPGHGGVLDRFDSYIFTGAVVYFYMRCLPLLGV